MTANPIIIGVCKRSAILVSRDSRQDQSEHSEIDEEEHAKKQRERKYMRGLNPVVHVVGFVNTSAPRQASRSIEPVQAIDDSLFYVLPEHQHLVGRVTFLLSLFSSQSLNQARNASF